MFGEEGHSWNVVRLETPEGAVSMVVSSMHDWQAIHPLLAAFPFQFTPFLSILGISSSA